MSCTLFIKQSIENNDYDSIPIISHGIAVSIDINLRKSQLFRFNVTRYSDIVFNNMVTSSGVAFTIKIYTRKGALVSTSESKSPISTVRTKVDRGDYYVCYETREIEGVTASSTMMIDGYNEAVNFPNTFLGAGFSSNYELYIKKKPPEPIDGNICMEVIDGKLPPGITMDINGRLHGQAPEMDCLEDNDEYSPSNNWKMRDGALVFSWGRQWRFKVKAFMCPGEKREAEPVYEWFCIKIFNNWNFDRDDFDEQLKNFREVITREIVEDIDTNPIITPEGLCLSKCEPEYDVPFIPTPTIPECKSCDETDEILPSVLIETIIVPPTLNIYVNDVFANHDDVAIIESLLLAAPQTNRDSISFVEKVKRSDIFRTYHNTEFNANHDISIRLNGSYIELVDIELWIEDLSYKYEFDANPYDPNYEYEQDILDQMEFDVNKTNPAEWIFKAGFDFNFELHDPFGIYAAQRPKPFIVQDGENVDYY